MLYLVGLGLGDSKDITVKGLEVVKQAKRVYLEAYTSILTVGVEVLEKFYGRKVIVADRETVEQNAEDIMKDADVEDIVLLVVGDPFGATTHTDFILRAIEKNIKYKVIHNASIMNAIGCCGLQLYNYGEAVSIVFWTETWKPESFYDKICSNKKHGLHTLCLLDIKIKEQSVENLMRKKKIFEPPRFLTVNQACSQLLEIVQRRQKSGEENCLTPDSICVGLARVGSDTQQIVTSTLQKLIDIDLGGPLHSLVIPGETHSIENDMLKQFIIHDDVEIKSS